MEAEGRESAGQILSARGFLSVTGMAFPGLYTVPCSVHKVETLYLAMATVSQTTLIMLSY